jgi:hypothetical protein
MDRQFGCRICTQCSVHSPDLNYHKRTPSCTKRRNHWQSWIFAAVFRCCSWWSAWNRRGPSFTCLVTPSTLVAEKLSPCPEMFSMKIANRCFQDVAKFKYLRTTLTDQNCMHEQFKSRLNSGNACCHSVQSLLSSRLLSRNVKVKTYKTIILPVACTGVKDGL